MKQARLNQHGDWLTPAPPGCRAGDWIEGPDGGNWRVAHVNKRIATCVKPAAHEALWFGVKLWLMKKFLGARP